MYAIEFLTQFLSLYGNIFLNFRHFFLVVSCLSYFHILTASHFDRLCKLCTVDHKSSMCFSFLKLKIQKILFYRDFSL